MAIMDITPLIEERLATMDPVEAYRSSHAARPTAPATGIPVIIGAAPPVGDGEPVASLARELATDAASEAPLDRAEETELAIEDRADEAPDARELAADEAADAAEPVMDDRAEPTEEPALEASAAIEL